MTKLEYKRQYRATHPWAGAFNRIKHRCNYPDAYGYERYGGAGIKCLITLPEVKALWVRDKADQMKQPSIDRIDPKGHYIFKNCRFIELMENRRGGWKILENTHIVEKNCVSEKEFKAIQKALSKKASIVSLSVRFGYSEDTISRIKFGTHFRSRV